ncbi:MAG: hypothetical protein HOP12_08145 [Candidatus Eisenbacteria bacterium]|uniref:Uncharacterized protein n=1 Tax=Eiseniibacteriota bacterium TaxID=2212470 RepID=A0A849SKA9_UNCEI|nr:hypothetical protein [Candidatus Eisenbacteria bacterium]
MRIRHRIWPGLTLVLMLLVCSCTSNGQRIVLASAAATDADASEIRRMLESEPFRPSGKPGQRLHEALEWRLEGGAHVTGRFFDGKLRSLTAQFPDPSQLPTTDALAGTRVHPGMTVDELDRVLGSPGFLERYSIALNRRRTHRPVEVEGRVWLLDSIGAEAGQRLTVLIESGRVRKFAITPIGA